MKREIWFLIIIVIILVFTVFLFISLTNQTNEFQKLNQSYFNYTDWAEGKIHGLEQENQQLNNSYNNLSLEYSDLKTQAVETISKIDDYEKNLQDSMDWFRFNSELSGVESNERSDVKSKLYGNCFNITENRCEIKTGCFFLVNFQLLGLRYRPDIQTTGKTDKLMSLQDFVNHYGGDCEDYALFYKAEFNYALQSCGDKEIRIEAWEDGNEKYFLNYPETWYMEDTSKINLRTDYTNPVVVCGRIFDFNSNQTVGHCIIGLIKNKITSSDNLKTELNKATLIEPQNGGYMGLLNDASSNIWIQNEEQSHDSYVTLIITDGDLFLYKESGEDKGKWLSYSEFYGELDIVRNGLFDKFQ
jgi:hypothetical protein